MVQRIPAVRIMVCGDPGTGKTALIRMLCKRNTKEKTLPTIGCYVDCGIFEGFTSKALVEFIEVSGKCKDYSLIELFLTLQPDGFIFTYNPCNKKTFRNIKYWYNAFNSPESTQSNISHYGDENASYIRLDNDLLDFQRNYRKRKRESLIIAMVSENYINQGYFPQVPDLESSYSATSLSTLSNNLIRSLDTFLSTLIVK